MGDGKRFASWHNRLPITVPLTIARLASLLLTSLLPTSPLLYAQVPQLIRYQGTLVDTNNVPLEGTYNLTFRVYDASTGGSTLWTETQSAVPISRGVFNVLLGQVTSLTLPFDKDYWLTTQVGTDTEMSPRQRLTSVPYAYRAEVSEEGLQRAQDFLKSELRVAERFQDPRYLLKQCLVDAFGTNVGIDPALSANHQYRGNPDYDVVTGVTEPVIQEATPETAGKVLGLMNDYYQQAQQFRLSSAADVSSVAFNIRSIEGAAGNIVVRIVTDAGGMPSGSLVTVDAIIVVNTQNTAGIKKATFAKPIPLAANTPYWLTFSLETPQSPPAWNWYVLSAGEQAGGGPYAGGALAYKANATAWNLDVNSDVWFRLYAQSQVSSATVVSTPMTIPSSTQEVLVDWVETSSTVPVVVSASRDNGVTWTPATKGEWLSLAGQPQGIQLRLKATIASDAQLEAWGCAW